jgi:hypothetical protein
VALFPIVETSTTSSLRRGCLVVLVGFLGQKGEVPGCSATDTGFLFIGCAGSTTIAAKGTTSGTVVDAGIDVGACVLEGDSARTAGVDCLRNGNDCCS